MAQEIQFQKPTLPLENSCDQSPLSASEIPENNVNTLFVLFESLLTGHLFNKYWKFIQYVQIVING